MKKMLVYNDDGWSSLMRYPAPATVEEIARRTVGLVLGTGVDIYQMCLLTGNVSIYESKILERYGDHLGKPYRMHMWRTIENIRSLKEQGTDLLRIVIDKCHQSGIEAHASLRINDKHHTYKMTPESSGLPSRFCRSEYVFPDLRSGWVEERPQLCLPDSSLDFLYEESRQLRIDTIREILDNYDVDGIDLDFTRFPPFFQEGHKEENSNLITDMVQKVRRLVNDKSMLTGKKIKLTARVEFDTAANKEEGLDVENWIRNGLIDILYLGVIADCTPDAPIDSFIIMCEGTGCKVCPSIEGQFHWVGGMNRTGPVRVSSLEMVRAFAANAYEAGADGIQLFNFCCADGKWDRNILTEIPFPDRFRFKDKLYYFTMSPARLFSLTCRWDSRLLLRDGENEARYSFIVSDHLAEGEKWNQCPSATLMMRIMGLNKRDDISLYLNDTALFPEKTTENLWDWDSWSDILHFCCPIDAINTGENALKIIRSRDYQEYIGEIEVIEMELCIHYPQNNTIGSI